MNLTSILLVGLEPKLQKLAREAGRLVCPTAGITPFRDLNEALRTGQSAGSELLALADPDKAVLREALRTTDEVGLRRWPVVVFGAAREVEGATFIPPEDWNERMTARVFCSAAALHAVRRENARLRGDLLTISTRICHHLSTPLGGLLLSAEALKEILEEVKPGSASQAQPLFDSADDLTRLVKRLSFFTKACSQPGAVERLSVGAVVHGALEKLESQCLARKASVVQPSSWPEVRGVHAWLEAIWWNFIANALQHGGDAPRIELGWLPGENEIRFWVGDRGAGVPGDHRRWLFQPFHLLHETNAPRGLGLAMVQRLVELQGGRCGYESNPGGGARFFFTWPLLARGLDSPPHLE